MPERWISLGFLSLKSLEKAAESKVAVQRWCSPELPFLPSRGKMEQERQCWKES